MIRSGTPTGRVFTAISDTNKVSRGLAEKQILMRAGQRSSMSKLGIKNKIIKDSILGR